jgi:pyruvate ferredoxin oxidoreductase delta subunit
MSAKQKGWKDLELGCVVIEPGSASAMKTGEWRSERPVRDNTRCIKCGVCYLYCPEGCINEDEDEFFEADLYYCKGCGICAHECPRGVITMVEEEEE